MSKISRKIIALSIISSMAFGVGVHTSASALTLDEMYKQAYEYTMTATNKATKHKVKPYYDTNGGVTETQLVANAVKDGMQLDIINARNKINALPDSLLQAKRTFSSILDNYQHPVYERAVATLEGTKSNPKQQDLNLVRHLIKDIPTFFKSCYSSAADQIQGQMFMTATNLVDKAIVTDNQQDISNAKNYIDELKANEFMTAEIQSFIDSLTNRLVNKIPNNNNQVSGIVFKDKNLEQAVRQAMNKPTGAISKDEALSVNRLIFKGKGIKDLSGIENFTNLTTLDLGVEIDPVTTASKTNSVTDLAPLSKLTNLRDLDLQENKAISVYQLRNLTNLEVLALSGNQLTDISELKNLTKLQSLLVDRNPLVSISVVNNFKSLEFLVIPKSVNANEVQTIKNNFPNCDINFN